MEEHRTDIAKSNEDISCNPDHQGKEGSGTNSLPLSPTGLDEMKAQSFTSPADQEDETDAETVSSYGATNELSFPPPYETHFGEQTAEKADNEQITTPPPDSFKHDEKLEQDEISHIPPANISFSSTQMILGIDPTQPVLMPGRPLLSPEDEERINKYRKFQKVDGAAYRRVNQFLRKHTYVTAREWAIARLCADFSTRGGAEMTFIGENLPDLVPFMTDTYSPQAVNQARSSFKKKVRKSGATFFYGALCGFFTADELDDILFEASEVARFLLEVEGTSLDIDDEIDIEDRITEVMRGVAEAASRIRNEEPDPADEEISGQEDDEA
jgi:hypothetical protein